MRILLDSHILLWWLSDSSLLTEEARGLLAEPENTLFVSAATIWELRIKQALGKLELPEAVFASWEKAGLEVLAIQASHADATAALPLLHRDPFDRMLIAQARTEGLVLLTTDEQVAAYGEGVRQVPRGPLGRGSSP